MFLCISAKLLLKIYAKGLPDKNRNTRSWRKNVEVVRIKKTRFPRNLQVIEKSQFDL